MPTRLCIHPGCANTATYRARCPTHTRTNERHTHHNQGIYNTKRWRMLRKRRLSLNPLCQAEGCEQLATDVDHILAIRDGGEPFTLDNTQGLCRHHHAKKTNAEVRAR